jgi:O-antigen biosynthesis protein
MKAFKGSLPREIRGLYRFDPLSGCWLPNDGVGEFAYSDGDEVERRIHDAVLAVKDLGSVSRDLGAHITDWPTKYHFSALRSNLLRPLQSLLKGSILEVGAGCGAITRFLGESGAEVLALEGSIIRASTAAGRCRDLENVSVLADAFHRLPPSPMFDVVTLIGVLEYARQYFPSETDDPVNAMLRHARSFLKPDGVLIVAIENQLGLKYFAGCGEDHVGVPMFGVEDRYHDGSVVTFGRKELQARLSKAGLPVQRWWYPFPDYKLPTFIVSEEMLEDNGGLLDAIIGPALEADPQLPRSPLFVMDSAWRPVCRNGLGPDLANSFLAIAGISGKAIEAAHVRQAYHFAAERLPEYAKQVVFSALPSGEIRVRQERLFPAMKPAGNVPIRMADIPEGGFVEGQLWSARLKTILSAPGWSVKDLVEWTAPWFDAILKLAGIEEMKGRLPASHTLSGSLLDALPRNFIVKSGGSSAFIDQEWSLNLPIELGFLVFRGLFLSLLGVGKVAPPASNTPVRAVSLVYEIAQSLGVWVVEADLIRYCGFESDIQKWVSAGRGLRPEDTLAYSLDVRPLLDLQRSSDEQLANLTNSAFVAAQRIEGLEAEVLAQKGALDARDEMLVRISEEKEQLGARLQTSEQKLLEYDARVGVLEAQSYSREVEIGRVVAENTAYAAQVAAQLQVVAERDLRIASLEGEASARAGDVESLREKIHAFDNKIVADAASAEVLALELKAVSALNVANEARFAGAIESLAQKDRLLAELQARVGALTTILSVRELEIAASIARVADRDAKISALTNAVNALRQGADALSLKNKSLQRSAELRRAEMMKLSNWADSINASPTSYALRKYSYQFARKVLRTLPISIATKQQLRDSLLSLTRPVRAAALGGGARFATAFELPARPELLQGSVSASQRDIFVFSVIDWHFRIQRPQHIARSFAESGRRVFYFSNHFCDADEPGYMIEQLPGGHELFQIKLNVKGAPAIYFAPPTAEAEAMLEASIARVIQDFGAVSTVSIVQHAYWYPLVKRLPNTYRVYDCMDHHEGFGNVPEKLVEIEKDMLAHADLVTVTSSWLDEFARSFNPSVAVVRNAGEYVHFAAKPDEVYVDPKGRKILGYYGAIADWFDLDLVRKLALSSPDCLVLLIGDDTVGARSALQGLDNVVFTGEVPYTRLPYYLYAFDACLLPFKVIPLTLATNPVKVYEYLASGKPVVCVDLPELSQFGDLVFKASSVDDFIACAKRALQPACNTTALVESRRAFAAAQTWGHRIKELSSALDTMQFPRISVIVLTYNNLDLTKACLESLVERSDYSNLEIVIVDNASSDNSPAYLREFGKEHDGVKVILNDSNLGFAAGNNVGMAAATGDYLVLLNNDTVVTRGWALTLVRHLQADESIGVIGPLTNNIGNEAKVEVEYRDVSAMPREALALTLGNMGRTYPMRNAAFFCAMMPRSTYERCGPISEDYGRGFFEDDDYCRMVDAVGLRVVCADDVFIHHHLSASFNKLKDEERQQLFARNKLVYEKKWGAWIPHEYRR